MKKPNELVGGRLDGAIILLDRRPAFLWINPSNLMMRGPTYREGRILYRRVARRYVWAGYTYVRCSGCGSHHERRLQCGCKAFASQTEEAR